MSNKESKEVSDFPLKVNGKYTKKDIKCFIERSWDLKSFAFCQGISFRFKDKYTMEKLYRVWFDAVIMDYGKSKWIECIIFCRPEDSKPSRKKKSK